MQGEDCQDLITIEHLAALVTQDAAVAVAVVGDAQAGTMLPHRRAHFLGIFAADAGVDVPAVRRIADQHQRTTKLLQHRAAGATGGTVGRIEDDPPASETARRQQGRHQSEVAGQGSDEGRDRQAGTGGTDIPGLAGGQQLLDAQFLLVGQLDAGWTEKLDAVVARGIVGGGNDHAQGGALVPRQQAHHRSRNDAEADRFQTFGLQTRSQRMLQCRARGAGVPADKHILGAEMWLRPDKPGHGGAKPPGEVFVHDRAAVEAAHAVSAKVLAFHER